MIDDKYLSGVWYDQLNGDYCEIQRGGLNDENERLVELVNPETNSVYWDMPVSKWVEDEQQDFRPVPEEAVEDPVSYLTKMLDFCQSNKQLYREEEVGLGYARQAVKIEEA
jgi:hypothetical protein